MVARVVLFTPLIRGEGLLVPLAPRDQRVLRLEVGGERLAVVVYHEQVGVGVARVLGAAQLLLHFLVRGHDAVVDAVGHGLVAGGEVAAQRLGLQGQLALGLDHALAQAPFVDDVHDQGVGEAIVGEAVAE
jgi:hypothetical protein